MTADRRARIIDHLYPTGGVEVEAARLAQVCAAVTGATGAGLMLKSDGLPGGSVATTDEVSMLIEDLQFSLGEGPCIDAYNEDQPVLEPDLVNPAVVRWVAFSEQAVKAGVRAIFGFPLQVGTVRLGALDLYYDRPGALTVDQHADALVVAGVAAQALLIMQANEAPGMLADELERGSNFHHVVHQASGMVAAQLGVSVAEALVRLRGYAFGGDRLLADVAQDFVARRLRFDGASDEVIEI